VLRLPATSLWRGAPICIRLLIPCSKIKGSQFKAGINPAKPLLAAPVKPGGMLPP
jgi:hypothetical protein